MSTEEGWQRSSRVGEDSKGVTAEGPADGLGQALERGCEARPLQNADACVVGWNCIMHQNSRSPPRLRLRLQESRAGWKGQDM